MVRLVFFDFLFLALSTTNRATTHRRAREQAASLNSKNSENTREKLDGASDSDLLQKTFYRLAEQPCCFLIVPCLDSATAKIRD
jgi:hypothetical protein